jgi:Interferon-induced 6-16 family
MIVCHLTIVLCKLVTKRCSFLKLSSEEFLLYDRLSYAGSAKLIVCMCCNNLVVVGGLAVVVGVEAAVLLAPVALGTLGFISAGIAANSIAAATMLSAAIANAAGSTVAVLQSVGAAGP